MNYDYILVLTGACRWKVQLAYQKMEEIVDSSRNIFPIQEKMSMCEIKMLSATK